MRGVKTEVGINNLEVRRSTSPTILNTIDLARNPRTLFITRGRSTFESSITGFVSCRR